MIYNTILGDKHAIIVWNAVFIFIVSQLMYLTFLGKKSGERGSLRRFSNHTF